MIKSAPQPRKKRFLGHFLGKSFYIENTMKIALLALKATKKRQTTFSKNQRHFDPQNVKIWRFRHDMVTLVVARLYFRVAKQMGKWANEDYLFS